MTCYETRTTKRKSHPDALAGLTKPVKKRWPTKASPRRDGLQDATVQDSRHAHAEHTRGNQCGRTGQLDLHLP
jgi:hypothetical protein